MQATRHTFIGRLGEGDEDAWTDFDAVYKPLLRHWLRDRMCHENDLEDLIQDVMLFVATHLKRFDHNTRTGAFRKWLREVTVNTARNHLRKQGREIRPTESLQRLIEGLQDDASRVSIAFEQDCQKRLLRQVLRRVERHFTRQTISIFRQYALDEASATDTAEAHGVTTAAVYMAKSKVLCRLREEWPEEFER